MFQACIFSFPTCHRARPALPGRTRAYRAAAAGREGQVVHLEEEEYLVGEAVAEVLLLEEEVVAVYRDPVGEVEYPGAAVGVG